MAKLKYQTPATKPLDRADHCWLCQGGKFKCVFCGATTLTPPDYPTAKSWMPDRFEKLRPEERELVPYIPKH